MPYFSSHPSICPCPNIGKPGIVDINNVTPKYLSPFPNCKTAVSSSGFTNGALRKSKALGIIVREFRSLTPSEIADWGKGTRAFVEYVQFGRTEVHLVVRDHGPVIMEDDAYLEQISNFNDSFEGCCENVQAAPSSPGRPT